MSIKIQKKPISFASDNKKPEEKALQKEAVLEIALHRKAEKDFLLLDNTIPRRKE